MLVPCPNCSAEVESDPGDLAACSACGHWWIVEEPAAADPEPLVAEAEAVSPEDALDVSPAEAPMYAPPPATASVAVGPGALLPPRQRDAIAPMPRPTPTPEEHPWEFELQLGVGDRVEGPFDRMYLREHVYMGRLTGDERVRVPGASTWARLGDRPEFAEIFSLLGKDTPAVVGNRRIAGWQKTGGAPSAPSTPGAGPPQPAAARPAPIPPQSVPPTGTGPSAGAVPTPGKGGSARMKLLAAAAVLAVLVLVAAGVLLA